MPQKIPTLSIVIPAYNEQRYLSACLDAIAAQTVKADEVIVVDNNSDDRTAEIARHYPFVTLLCEPNQGRVFARNRGFDIAAGDLIGRIDADTIIPPVWVAHIKAFYQRAQNANVAWTGASHYYNVRTPLFDWAQRMLAFHLNRLLLGYYAVWGSNMVMPTVLWRKVRHAMCTRLDIHEDLDMAIHVHDAGNSTVYDDSCRVGTALRHMRSDRRSLWQELVQWPRTMRLHRLKLWPVSFVLVSAVYCFSFLPSFFESVARMAGLAPLEE